MVPYPRFYRSTNPHQDYTSRTTRNREALIYCRSVNRSLFAGHTVRPSKTYLVVSWRKTLLNNVTTYHTCTPRDGLLLRKKTKSAIHVDDKAKHCDSFKVVLSFPFFLLHHGQATTYLSQASFDCSGYIGGRFGGGCGLGGAPSVSIGTTAKQKHGILLVSCTPQTIRNDRLVYPVSCY